MAQGGCHDGHHDLAAVVPSRGSCERIHEPVNRIREILRLMKGEMVRKNMSLYTRKLHRALILNALAAFGLLFGVIALVWWYGS
ncbi:MAG: hypothetical protein WCJ29_01970 [bacterium]